MRRPVTRFTMLAAAAALATGCAPVRHNLPPEQRLMEPGPGVGGPGPGVLGPVPVSPYGGGYGAVMPGSPMADGYGGVPMGPEGQSCPPGQQPFPTAMNEGEGGDLAQTSYCPPGGGIPTGGGVIGPMGMMPATPPTMQVTFGRPDSMSVRYEATGTGGFDSEPLIVPARQNFPQGGIYRLKLTNIANREGVELYPTLELAYANPRTGAYLAHNSVPVQFTEEDFDQVLTGNFVTKVIYLPDPDYQGPALAGIDTLVSTRLDPGIDPITEADRRGSILAIIRLGDKDIEMSGTSEFPGAGMGGMGMGGGVPGMPMAFAPAMTEGCGPDGSCGAGGSCGPSGCGCGSHGAGGNCASPVPPMLPGIVAGVTAPQYGMPISGTPIGLPGPPHIPLGHQASLKKHTIKNYTHMNIPKPVDNIKIGVRQAPGMSYPNPVSRIHMTEQNINPGVPYGRPHYDAASQRVDGAPCPPN